MVCDFASGVVCVLYSVTVFPCLRGGCSFLSEGKHGLRYGGQLVGGETIIEATNKSKKKEQCKLLHFGATIVT